MRLPKDFFSYYSLHLPTLCIYPTEAHDWDSDHGLSQADEVDLMAMRVHSFELIQQESGIQVHCRYDWHIKAMPERYTYDKTGQKQPQ